MARPRKEKRTTKFVTLRKKDRAKGIQVLYLDIYMNGKRSYEFLKDEVTGRKLYLVPEINEDARVRNENEMAVANAICAQREIEIVRNGQLQPKTKTKILLSDWMEAYRKQKETTGQSYKRAQTVGIVKKHLEDFAGKKTILADIDDDFCKRFILYLGGMTSKICTIHPKPITTSTAKSYFQVFNAALNDAVRKKLIPANPVMYLSSEDKKPIKASKSLRSFLTIDEVRRLIETDFRNDQVKRAFLFACFTGLRISDIKNLTSENLEHRNGNTYLHIKIQKTQQDFEIKLNKDALRWMPKVQKGNIFTLPRTCMTINKQVKEWAKAAGIEKDVCFHMSRHTFATMALTLGADLYTVSKLLGHQNITITQVYAEIIDEKKDKAVDLTNGLFDKDGGQ